MSSAAIRFTRSAPHPVHRWMMDHSPFCLDPDGYRLHPRPAGGSSVPVLEIHVHAPETSRTMVAILRAGLLVRHKSVAPDAIEKVVRHVLIPPNERGFGAHRGIVAALLPIS